MSLCYHENDFDLSDLPDTHTHTHTSRTAVLVRREQVEAAWLPCGWAWLRDSLASGL